MYAACISCRSCLSTRGERFDRIPFDRNSDMGRVSANVFGASVMLAAASGFAQVVPFPPELQNRIPAPLLPPPPPIINGPLGESPPPGVYHPPQLDTFADRTTRCLHDG